MFIKAHFTTVLIETLVLMTGLVSMSTLSYVKNDKEKVYIQNYMI